MILKLPTDYFEFIIVDECHRSIYGKWRSSMDYFFQSKDTWVSLHTYPEHIVFL